VSKQRGHENAHEYRVRQLKTTLSAAITMYCAKKYGDKAMRYDQIDNAPEEKACGITINSWHLEYQLEKRRYVRIDCLGRTGCIKNMITGAAWTDRAVLVVSFPDSLVSRTREHIILAGQVGVPSMIVLLNKVDLVNNSEPVEEINNVEKGDLLECLV
jgi:elongation factor Tu